MATRRPTVHQLKYMLADNLEDTQLESLGQHDLAHVAATARDRGTRQAALAMMGSGSKSRCVYVSEG